MCHLVYNNVKCFFQKTVTLIYIIFKHRIHFSGNNLYTTNSDWNLEIYGLKYAITVWAKWGTAVWKIYVLSQLLQKPFADTENLANILEFWKKVHIVANQHFWW